MRPCATDPLAQDDENERPVRCVSCLMNACTIRSYAHAPVPVSQPASAADTLRRAAQLIEDRAALRDRPSGEKSMLATVAAFNLIYGTELTEVQGWHFMELLKMVRSAYGVYVADDYDDKVAYAALAAEAAAS